MSAKDRLQALEAALRERGVVDVKFFFSKGAQTALSEVATDVADVLDAVIKGQFTKFEGFNDLPQAAA